MRDYIGGLSRRASTLRARWILEDAGAGVGAGLVAYGKPIVSMEPGSKITLGRKAVLCSDPRFTALGVGRPVILRTLASGARIEIGDEVGLSGVTICAASSVTIGNRCLLGADVVIVDTDFHPVRTVARRHAAMPNPRAADRVRIGDDVFVGARSVILKGVEIGRGAVVGAGAVVTRDVAPFAIVAGNPARHVGTVPGETMNEI